MADISLVIDVKQNGVVSAVKNTKTLERNVKLLSDSFKNNNLSQYEYYKGLLQLAKASGKSEEELRKYGKEIRKAERASAAAAAQAKREAQARKEAAAQAKLEAQAQRAATQAAAEAARVARTQADANRRLRMEFREGYAAKVALRAAQMRLNQARRQGIITDEEYQKQLERLNLVNRGNVRGTNNLGVAMQQTGYQVGDFLVQIQSGTNPMVAFGQQATQLVGVLYLLPATTLAASKSIMGLSVSVGFLVASLGIIIPLATAIGAYFMRMKESAESASDSMTDFSGAIDDFKRYVQLASEETGVLHQRFSDFYGEVREFSEYMQGIALAETFEALSASIDPIEEGLERALSLIDQIERQKAILQRGLTNEETPMSPELALQFRESIALLEDQLFDFSQELGLLPDQVEQFADALSNLSGSSGIEEIRDNAGEVLDLIKEWYPESINLAGPLRDIVKQVEEIARQTAEAKAEMDSLGASGWGLSDAMSSVNAQLSTGVTLSSSLWTNLSGAAGSLWEALGQVGRDQAAQNASITAYRQNARLRSLTPEFPPTTGAPRRPKARPFELGVPDLPETSGGGGASNVVDINAILDARRQQIEQERVLLGLTGQQREAKEIYFDLLQQNEDAVNSLTEAELMGAARTLAAEQEKNRVIEEGLQRQKEISDMVGNSFGNALMSIVDGTKSVKDAFKSMAADIIKELYRVLVVQRLVNSVSGFVGGLLPNANGNAFSGGNVIPFANGGVVGSPTMFPMSGGRTGLMGEAGPEAIMPLKRGADGRLGVEASGGGGNVTVVQNFNIAANGDESVKRIVRAETPRMAEAAKAAVLDSKRRGGAYGRSF